MSYPFDDYTEKTLQATDQCLLYPKYFAQTSCHFSHSHWWMGYGHASFLVRHDDVSAMIY